MGFFYSHFKWCCHKSFFHLLAEVPWVYLINYTCLSMHNGWGCTITAPKDIMEISCKWISRPPNAITLVTLSVYDFSRGRSGLWFSSLLGCLLFPVPIIKVALIRDHPMKIEYHSNNTVFVLSVQILQIRLAVRLPLAILAQTWMGLNKVSLMLAPLKAIIWMGEN